MGFENEKEKKKTQWKKDSIKKACQGLKSWCKVVKGLSESGRNLSRL